MKLDYDTVVRLRSHDPAWKLLYADYAPLIVSVLYRTFTEHNRRQVPRATVIEILKDQMFAISQQSGHVFGKTAQEYLDDWSSPEKEWLRVDYLPGTDEQVLDLTPYSVKVIDWLTTLGDRSFVGTESALLTVVELLRQIARGSEADPIKRFEDLERRRDELDAEITRVKSGDIEVMTDAAVKDRFQQAQNLARGILSDFRAVEQNFRQLDRAMREKIASFDGAKGKLLEEMIGERNAIADSDQGRSFRAFWEFLLSAPRQEELTGLLEQVVRLPAVSELEPDRRMRRIHHDWIEAGEHTQRMVASLSQQLRRFLDDRAYLENRRIMDILRSIETRALALRDAAPTTIAAPLIGPGLDVRLPLERPLYRPYSKLNLKDVAVEVGDALDLDTSALFDQVNVDTAALCEHISLLLEDRRQVTLKEVVQRRPLEAGLAELIAYLQLSVKTFPSHIDPNVVDEIEWVADEEGQLPALRRAKLPRLIYLREAVRGF